MGGQLMDWPMVTAILGIVAFVSGVWWRIEGMARRNAEALAAHKLHVAENYTTKTDLGKATEQIMGAIDGLNNVVTRIADRMDRFVDQPQRPRAGQSRA